MITHYSKEKNLQQQSSNKILYYSKPRYKLNIPKKSLSYKKLMGSYIQDSNIQKTFNEFLLNRCQYSKRLNKKNLSSKNFQLNESSKSKFKYLLSKSQNFGQNLSNQAQKKTINQNSKKTNRTINNQKINISNDQGLNYYRKTVRCNQPRNNLSLQEPNQTKFCKILIGKEKSKTQYNYKVTTAPKLLKFLLNLIKDSIGFKSNPKNLLLDIFITLESQECNLSFLNGNSLVLQPIFKQLSPYISASSFQIIKCIGSGGFSKVFLCRFKQNGKFYAMKMIDKKFIIKNNKWKIVMNQRNIMKKLKHPFIIDMKFAFQSQDNIIFVLEYCPGGQLFQLIKKYKRISESKAKFYMIQILLALQYMHKQGVLYRDFKPQNILLDIQGHVKIADFGLAKPNYYSIQDRSFSFCGSPQYMPPQMILRQGHSLPVDFYCLGAVLYELVTGLPPFYNKNPDQIYSSTVNQKIKFPQNLKLSEEIKNLLCQLLQKDQIHRMGSKLDVKQVLSHSWFGNIQKKNYLSKLVKPPVNFVHIESISVQFQQYSDSIFLEQAKKQQQQSKFKVFLKDFEYDFRNQQFQIKNNFNLQRKSYKHSKLISNEIFKRKLTDRSFNSQTSQKQLRNIKQEKPSQICSFIKLKQNFKLKKTTKNKIYYRLNTNDQHKQKSFVDDNNQKNDIYIQNVHLRS